MPYLPGLFYYVGGDDGRELACRFLSSTCICVDSDRSAYSPQLILASKQWPREQAVEVLPAMVDYCWGL